MRSIEDKNCVNNGSSAQEIPGGSCMSFDFHKNNGGGGGSNRSSSHHHRTALGKPTPSKWDDAQKWLVNLSRGGDKLSHPKASPRNSNADDRRLIAPPVPKKDYSSGDDDDDNESSGADQFETETKNVVDCEEETSVWRINKPANSSSNNASKNAAVRSICVRDMGTEMTPIASQEPSRTATPIRATTPAVGSPMSSGALSPVWRCNNDGGNNGQNVAVVAAEQPCRENGPYRQGQQSNSTVAVNNKGGGGGGGGGDIAKKMSPLESRAVAWDEAERAKYTARYKREEVKIQAWENHQKRKAEMEMRKVEVKAERLKARAQEKYTNKLASTRRIAEEKRANAEAKLNEKAIKTSESADYIRRTGHLPSFSFKLPSFCCCCCS